MELYKFQGTKVYNLVSNPTITIDSTIPETIPTLAKFGKQFEIQRFLINIRTQEYVSFDFWFRINNQVLFSNVYDSKLSNYIILTPIALAANQSLEVISNSNRSLTGFEQVTLSAQYELTIMGV